MSRRKESGPRASRMNDYVPLIREFATRDALFHDAVARKLGLHSTDEKVLRLLGDAALTAGDLVAYTGLTGAAVTALIDRLESLGYVTRERDSDDRRRVTIRAVGAKLREINRLYGELHAAMDTLLAQYDNAEFAIVIDFLGATATTLAEQTAKLAGDKKVRKAKGT
jgi:DNA-binding MarR family transcriptional regulator